MISDSWDVPLSGRLARQFPQTGDYTFKGVTTVAASGDAGYPGASTNDFPAALPDVTAAGGTTLEPASASGVASAREFTESAWSDAGSGCNLGASKPAWQTDSGCTGRSYADISADADPDTGMQVYDSNRRRLGRRRRDQRGLAADRRLLRPARFGRPGPVVGVRERIAAQRPDDRFERLVRDVDRLHLRRRARLRRPDRGRKHLRRGHDRGAGDLRPRDQRHLRAQHDRDRRPALGRGLPERHRHQLLVGVRPDHRLWPADPRDRIGSGTAPVAVSDSLTGLSPGTTYHYRLVAQNQTGTEYGYDFTLTTPASSTTSPTQGTATSADHHHPVSVSDHDHDHDEQSARHRGWLGRLGDVDDAARRPARDQPQGRPGGERRDDQRHDRGPGSRHDLRAPVRPDGIARADHLGLAGVVEVDRDRDLGAPRTCLRARSITSARWRPTPRARPRAR